MTVGIQCTGGRGRAVARYTFFLVTDVAGRTFQLYLFSFLYLLIPYVLHI
jgi:hypothetical protein